MKTCGVDGCTLKMKCRGYCNKHYQQMHVRGKGKYPPVPWKQKPGPEERFWSRVDKSAGEAECWMWTGSQKKKKGDSAYGGFTFNGTTWRAHRYSYHLANPDEAIEYVPVHHKCGNSLCVNPAHLQTTTQVENTAEMLERRFYIQRIKELEAKLAGCTCG